jgi:hypothetical protein
LDRRSARGARPGLARRAAPARIAQLDQRVEQRRHAVPGQADDVLGIDAHLEHPPRTAGLAGASGRQPRLGQRGLEQRQQRHALVAQLESQLEVEPVLAGHLVDRHLQVVDLDHLPRKILVDLDLPALLAPVTDALLDQLRGRIVADLERRLAAAPALRRARVRPGRGAVGLQLGDHALDLARVGRRVDDLPVDHQAAGRALQRHVDPVDAQRNV